MQWALGRQGNRQLTDFPPLHKDTVRQGLGKAAPTMD